jgi:hypothetical protein
MLKDRRVLIEQEVAKQKTVCGHLYLKIVRGQGSLWDETQYATEKETLSDMLTDLMIVNQMITDGHE